jgi:hypothetical protein
MQRYYLIVYHFYDSLINDKFYKLTYLIDLPRYLTGNLFTGPLPNWIARPDYT